MKNYYQVHDWMRTIATPVSDREFTYDHGSIEIATAATANVTPRPAGLTSGSPTLLSLFFNNYRPVAEFVFKDCHPTSLSTLSLTPLFRISSTSLLRSPWLTVL